MVSRRAKTMFAVVAVVGLLAAIVLIATRNSKRKEGLTDKYGKPVANQYGAAKAAQQYGKAVQQYGKADQYVAKAQVYGGKAQVYGGKAGQYVAKADQYVARADQYGKGGGKHGGSWNQPAYVKPSYGGGWKQPSYQYTGGYTKPWTKPWVDPVVVNPWRPNWNKPGWWNRPNHRPYNDWWSRPVYNTPIYTGPIYTDPLIYGGGGYGTETLGAGTRVAFNSYTGQFPSDGNPIVMTSTPGMYTKMPYGGTGRFAIRNERNGLYLTVSNSRHGSYGYHVSWANFSTGRSLWTAQPAMMGCSQPFVNVMDASGRKLEFAGSSGGYGVYGVGGMVGGGRVLRVSSSPMASTSSCWLM